MDMPERDKQAVKENMTLHSAIMECYLELNELYKKCHTAADWQKYGGDMDVINNKLRIYSEAA